jgi:hypothetical protein
MCRETPGADFSGLEQSPFRESFSLVSSAGNSPEQSLEEVLLAYSVFINLEKARIDSV